MFVNLERSSQRSRSYVYMVSCSTANTGDCKENTFEIYADIEVVANTNVVLHQVCQKTSIFPVTKTDNVSIATHHDLLIFMQYYLIL